MNSSMDKMVLQRIGHELRRKTVSETEAYVKTHRETDCPKTAGAIKDIVADIRMESLRQEGLVNRRREAKASEMPNVYKRLANHLIRIGRSEIQNRNLPTPAGWSSVKALLYDRKPGLWLIGAEYRYHYSRKAGDWWVGAAYLCGKDDGEMFAVRVARSCHSVAAALEEITPAAVRKAQQVGKWIGRQGDVWLVEIRGKDNMKALPWSHDWNAETRTLTHGTHASLTVPANVKAVRAYVNVSRTGRKGGD